MHGRHAKGNVNAARRRNGGGMIVSYREAQTVILGGACPKIKCPVGLK